MGFQVQSELTGNVGLLFELPGRVSCVIELKYCPNIIKLEPEKVDSVLSDLAGYRLSTEVINESLAEAARSQLRNNDNIHKIMFKYSNDLLTISEKNLLLSKIAIESLSLESRSHALATTARQKLPPNDISEALIKATPKTKLTDKQIDAELDNAVKEALSAIREKDYHGQINSQATDIIDLCLAVYGDGSKVKTAFKLENPVKRKKRAFG
jgi:hypothetical protein